MDMWELQKCKLSMNLPLNFEIMQQFSSHEDLKQFYQKYGLNGLEVICAEENPLVKYADKIDASMINGQHLFFHSFWLDWWRKNWTRLDYMFDSRKQWIDYYNGMDREVLLNQYRKELEMAEKMQASYVVYHVSEVSLDECYTFKFLHSDEEVIDASLEIINTLLGEREYSFEFLVENQWWPGFTMKNMNLTKKLLNGIKSKKKGIMLDTGHFMVAKELIKTSEEGIDCLMELAKECEKQGVLKYIHGIHLHQSVSGNKIDEIKKGNFKKTKNKFYDSLGEVYKKVCEIDMHKPFENDDICGFLKKVQPKYITFEFQHGKERTQYEENLRIQSKALSLF